MVKKKLLIGSLSVLGAAVVATAVGVGYVQNAKANRFQPYGAAPQSASIPDLIQSYFSAAVNGSKLLYLASFSHTAPLTEALCITEAENAPQFNYLGKTGYILIDDQYGNPVFNSTGGLAKSSQPIWSTNVAAAQFRSDLGSFVTGIAVAQFLNENMSYFAPGPNDTLTWATYGGVPIPPVTSFMGGLQRGIEWFNKNVVNSADGKAKKFKPLQQFIVNNKKDDFNSNFAGGFAPGAGNVLITDILNNNVDVIFPVAGPQVGDAARAIKTNNKKAIVIGVDSPCEDDGTVNLPLNGLNPDEKVGNNQIIQFSSIKNLNVLSNKITQVINNPKVNDGSPAWANIGGFGYSSIGGLDNSGVGVSPAGEQYFTRAMIMAGKISNTNPNLDAKTQYINAIDALQKLQEFKDLNLPENKTYFGWSYASIANNGFYMLPIYQIVTNPKTWEADIDKWYDNAIKTGQIFSESRFREKNLSDIKEWIISNKQTIINRYNEMKKIEGGLTKDAWEKNHSIVKIMYQSPTNVLFDHSFLESCYNGLRDYWKTQGVTIPVPPTASK